MIKNIITLLSIFLCMGFASTAFAATSTTGSTGETLTMTADNSPGPILSYTPSPSTLMSCTTTAVAYSITSASSKTTTDNGLEYGILFFEEGYYQRAQTTNYLCPATTSAVELPSGEDWMDKNGSTPGTP